MAAATPNEELQKALAEARQLRDFVWDHTDQGSLTELRLKKLAAGHIARIETLAKPLRPTDDVESMAGRLWDATKGGLSINPTSAESDVSWEEWKEHVANYPHSLGKTLDTYRELASRLLALSAQSLPPIMGEGLGQPKPQDAEPVVTLELRGRPIDVDGSLAPVVAALNAAGVETVASCSGHGHRPGKIALRDGREIIIVRNWEEGRKVDRLFPVGANGSLVGADVAPTLKGESLRALRMACGVKAVDLAKALDISPEHISRMESGTKPITRVMSLAIRTALATPSLPEGMVMVPDELRALSAKASKGPWEVETEPEPDAEYGSGPDLDRGFDNFIVFDGINQLLLGTATSDAKCIVEEPYGDEDGYRQAWDETGKANVDFVVSLVNWFRQALATSPASDLRIKGEDGE